MSTGGGAELGTRKEITSPLPPREELTRLGCYYFLLSMHAAAIK